MYKAEVLQTYRENTQTKVKILNLEHFTFWGSKWAMESAVFLKILAKRKHG
jgi:hypothetical protein